MMKVITMVQWKGGVGKCVDGATRITDPATGLPRTLREAVLTAQPDVPTVVDRSEISVAPVTGHINSGRQHCLRLLLASGRSVIVTPSHPLLLPDGWRPAGEVSVGETVAIPARLPPPRDPVPLPQAELDVLAVLLAEGGCTGGDIRFTSADPSIVELVRTAAAELDMTVTPRGHLSYSLNGVFPLDSHLSALACRCGCGEASALAPVTRRKRGIVAGLPLGVASGHQGRRARADALVRRHKMLGVHAKRKAMPRAVFQLLPEQLGRFLAIFWMCDGYVDSRGPGLTLASESLVRDIQHLLLRFGIQSVVRARTSTSAGKGFPAWTLSVISTSRRAFLFSIPLWGEKRRRLVGLVESLKPNPNLGAPSFSKSLQAQLQKAVPLLRHHASPAIAGRPRWRPGGPSFAQVARELGWVKFQWSTLSNPRTSTVSPSALRALTSVYELGLHEWLCSRDIYWDRVVEIVDAGERDVYDLEVRSTDCFIGNDVILHNSTLAVHFAASLGAVLIDLEPWGGATAWWAGSRANELWQAAGPAPVLKALEVGRPPRPRRGEAGRPSLVPSHEQLLALTGGVAEGVAAWAWTADGLPTLMVPTAEGPRPLAEALRVAIPRWAQAWGLHVVVDTPAGFGPLADGAIAAADVVVLPVSMDQWAVPALRKFMRAYADRVQRGIVIPNRVRPRVVDDAWAEVIGVDGVIEPPFMLGPPIPESEVLHTARRPLTAGGIPGAARSAAIAQVNAAAQRTLELAAE